MDPWLIALGIVVLLLVALVFLPLRLGLSLRARGDPSGAWAAAGGGQIGPLALSGVAAQGVSPRVSAHVFGKKLWERDLAALGEKKTPRETAESAKRSYDKLERWFDPLELVLFLVQERRRIRIEIFEVDVTYSFQDIALTGKTLAALYVLGGTLPAPIVIRPKPSWEAEDRADLALSGKIRVWPGLVLVDTTWFVLRRVKLRRRDASPGAREAT